MSHPTSMLPSDYACPRCTCTACYALHRKGFDWVMSQIGLRPARCLTCGKRFYARYTIADSQPQPSSNQEKSSAGSRNQSAKDQRGRTGADIWDRARRLYSRTKSFKTGRNDKAA